MFKTPTPKVNGELRPSLFNFIPISYAPNLAHPHCCTEVAILMSNPPMPKEAVSRWRRSGYTAMKPYNHPQDIKEEFTADGHIRFIYKNYLFCGHLDGWAPDSHTIKESKKGKGHQRPINDRIQTFCYAYGICRLEGLTTLSIDMCNGNLRDVEYSLTYDHEKNHQEVEGWLDSCVKWASGERNTQRRNCKYPYDNYRNRCEILDFRVMKPFYECPYYG